MEYIDLGLSIKWATCNIGANKPEEYGDYYAWGETEEKDNYDWPTYKWCKGDYKTMTKYCTQSKYGYNGFTDNKTVLEPEDDAVHIKLGGNWRMPTIEEWKELVDNCDWIWDDDYKGTGIKGYIVTSKKPGYADKSIFLPAAGYRYIASLYFAGSYGNYWSSSLAPDYPNDVKILYFNSGSVSTDNSPRYDGQSVRPVYDDNR